MKFDVCVCLLYSSLICIVLSEDCVKRRYSHDSVVCVCNSTYCDFIPNPTKEGGNQFVFYTSSKAGDRLEKREGKFDERPHLLDENDFENLLLTNDMPYELAITFKIDRSRTYQKVLGFGGAFTDSSGINILSLPQDAQDNVLKSYFSTEGIGYTVGRVPMAGCDFSTRPYSYNDNDQDYEMTRFELQPEDLKYKIPIINRANSILSESVLGCKLKLMATPWSSPAWMKTNQDFAGKGRIKGEPGGKYYKSWALYFVKFFQEYLKNGVSFWGLTAQNEPTDGELNNFTFNALGFTAELQRDFIAKDLGPSLSKNGLGDLKLMILDDLRLMLPKWAQVVLDDPKAAKYISGIAIHWYLDFFVPPEVLTLTHSKFPDKFILSTEACEGSFFWEAERVALGEWERAENYAKDIIGDFLHWTIGWVDWNLALDLGGGPNWARNFVDAPIVVNSSAGEFYKQPMFYTLGHFSKFVLPDSVRIDVLSDLESDAVAAVAFFRPDNATVFVVLNREDRSVPITIEDPQLGYISQSLPPKSIQTYVWWHK